MTVSSDSKFVTLACHDDMTRQQTWDCILEVSPEEDYQRVDYDELPVGRFDSLIHLCKARKWTSEAGLTSACLRLRPHAFSKLLTST